MNKGNNSGFKEVNMRCIKQRQDENTFVKSHENEDVQLQVMGINHIKEYFFGNRI